MELHLRIEGQHDLRGQIYRQLRAGIVSGRFAALERLPASRELARKLGVSRNTVAAAYDLLVAEGLLAGRAGDGTYVADLRAVRDDAARVHHEGLASAAALRPLPLWERQRPPLSGVFAPAAVYDFRPGVPELRRFPREIWSRYFARELRELTMRPGHPGEPAGERTLQEAIAKFIAYSRAVACDPAQIVITNGAQHAFELLARTLIEPGMVVAVEQPGYPMARACFAAHAANVVGTPVDEQGLLVEQLPDAARIVYVTPSHQFPLGVPMSDARRHQLLAWANARRALVIEDDYDSEYRFEGRSLDALQSLDRQGLVAYVGSFSKTLFPSLRLGFVVAPAGLRAALVQASWLSGWHAHQLEQRVLARFMRAADMAKYIRVMHRIYDARRRAVLDQLTGELAPHLEALPNCAGLHMASWLKRPVALQALVSSAREHDLGLYPLTRFGYTESDRQGLVFGYGGLDERAIGKGFARLKSLLSSGRFDL